MKNLLIISFAITLLLTAACKQKPAPVVQETKTNIVVNDSEIDGRADAHMDSKVNEAVNKVINKWASNINARNIAGMDSLYADTVFLKQEITLKAGMDAYWKKNFANNQDFSITIANQIWRIGNKKTYLTMFRGIIKNNGKDEEENYQIRLKQFADGWKIVEEGTNGDKFKKMRAQYEAIKLKDITNCDKAAEAVVRSSLPFMSLISQPGAELKLEFRPGDKNGPYGKYQYSVFGYKPGSNERVNLSTFQLETATGKMYQLRPGENKPFMAAYPPKYKEYINKYCK